MTKWYNSYEYKPKHGTQVWFWNQKLHRKELFNCFWDETFWDAKTVPPDYAPIWAYVFEEYEPIYIQPERLNESASQEDAKV